MDKKSWHTIRRTGIGASESAAIMGVSEFMNPLLVYANKVALFSPEEREESEYQEWGHRHERTIVDAYAEKTQSKILTLNQDPVLGGPLYIHRHQTIEIMLATPDAEIIQGEHGRGYLEAKTSDAFNWWQWKDGELPLVYQIQTQHQMAVKGVDWLAWAALIGGNRFMHGIAHRNEGFIQEALIPSIERFWEKHVIPRRPPRPDGTKASERALKLLYPKDSGKTVFLSKGFTALDNERQAIQAQIGPLMERKRELDNQIKATIGDASKAVLPDGAAFILKSVEKKGHTVKASSHRQLRRQKGKS